MIDCSLTFPPRLFWKNIEQQKLEIQICNRKFTPRFQTNLPTKKKSNTENCETPDTP